MSPGHEGVSRPHGGAGRKQRTRLDGVLLLDKPSGISSQGAVSRAKGLFGAAKAGHTGTLDPMATGLLPLAFGEATKFAHALLDADKGYRALVRLGVTTTTGDLEGEVTAVAPVDVDRKTLEDALVPFRGEIVQTPPMYSALKHAGKPLYEYARAGTDIPRTPRKVTIRELTLETFDGTDACIHVACSKGTYIRVLAEDIGKALGCGATLAALRRTQVGRFTLDGAVGLAALADMTEDERRARVLPADALLEGLPVLALDAEQARRMAHGQVVVHRGAAGGLVRVYGPGSAFIGLAEASDDGALTARRLVSSEPVKA
ncbi:MAG: tRNA pseudouridine synthase [Betaproteobacteria bacterium]|nr:tRNA pseudouridine synthase [Betaproteobacteria bacterium]